MLRILAATLVAWSLAPISAGAATVVENFTFSGVPAGVSSFSFDFLGVTNGARFEVRSCCGAQTTQVNGGIGITDTDNRAGDLIGLGQFVQLRFSQAVYDLYGPVTLAMPMFTETGDDPETLQMGINDQLQDFTIGGAGDGVKTVVEPFSFLMASSSQAFNLLGIESGAGNGFTFNSISASVDIPDPIAPVPLPAGLPLLIAGLGALGLMRRSYNRQ